MEKRRIVIKRRNVLLSMLLVVLGMVILFVSFAPMNTKAATNNDYANSDVVTYKYLTVTLENKSMFVCYKNVLKEVGSTTVGRNNVDLTVLFRFQNVLDKNGNPVLVIGNVKAELPALMGMGKKIIFLSNATVNLRVEYYDYFKKYESRMSDCSIQVYSKSYTEPLYTKSLQWAADINKKDKYLVNSIPARVFEDKDLNDDAFVDNGGADVSKPAVDNKDKSFFNAMWNGVAKVFNWLINQKWFPTAFCIFVIAIIISIAINKKK